MRGRLEPSGGLVYMICDGGIDAKASDAEGSVVTCEPLRVWVQQP